VFVGVYRDRSIFPGIVVVDEELVIPVLLPDGMDIAKITATFPALEALEWQDRSPR